jgi:carbamoyltransferase
MPSRPEGVSIRVGLGGVTRNACVSLLAGNDIVGVCEQERITRVRGAGFNPSGLPDEALDELLRRVGRRRSDVTEYLVAEDVPPSTSVAVRLDHHFTHACSAFLPSPFETALIVICDHGTPQVSIWKGEGADVSPLDVQWSGTGFAELYSQCAQLLGFAAGGHEQRMEALARLDTAPADDRAATLFGLDPEGLWFASDWLARIERWSVGQDLGVKAAAASALQRRIADLVVEFVSGIRRAHPEFQRLCLGGSLFFNSHINTRVKVDCGFDEVFVPINPGNAGLAVGAALHAGRCRPAVQPFLGPAYTPEEVKATLDNCKLTYRWASESEAVTLAVDALLKGQLVAWFDGPMEWGPRALGARSIVANPFAPYALDNLNRFLKQREPWRGYALSGLRSAVRDNFEGPADSPFMECDYHPKDPAQFRQILPAEHAYVRVHTVDSRACASFKKLLEAFGAASGCPVLVNTSFNGFREPIVCSPRDAIRVFFGTGIDVLILGQFVVAK